MAQTAFQPKKAPKTIAIIVSPSPKARCFINKREIKEIISKNKNATVMPMIAETKVSFIKKPVLKSSICSVFTLPKLK